MGLGEQPSYIICYIWRPFVPREIGSRDQRIRAMGKRGKSCQTGGEMVNCCKGRCERGETLHLCKLDL